MNVCPAGGFSSRLFHLVQEEDWTQHVSEPIRYRAEQRPSLLILVFTYESHLIDRIQISEPLVKTDHTVLEFDYLCYWTCKLASTKLLRNFSKADFKGLFSHLAETIHLDGSVNELFARIQSADHEADLKYVPRRPVKHQSAPSLRRRICRLLDSRAHLFAIRRYTQFAEDITTYRKVRNQCRKENPSSSEKYPDSRTEGGMPVCGRYRTASDEQKQQIRQRVIF